jgi:undecaprenyl-diphosphatase
MEKTPNQPVTNNLNALAARPAHMNAVVGLIVGLLLLIPTAIAAHSHNLTGLQARIFYDFDNIQLSSGFTTAARILTEALGAAYAIAACVLASLAVKRYRLAWRFFFTAGASTVVFYLIKKIIKEPRPIAMLHGHLQQRVMETGPGFPSGHVTAATALALTLFIVMPRRWRWVAALWILLVAVSRLYLGVHTPGDVIAGFAVGLIVVCSIQLLPIKWLKILRLEA